MSKRKAIRLTRTSRGADVVNVKDAARGQRYVAIHTGENYIFADDWALARAADLKRGGRLAAMIRSGDLVEHGDAPGPAEAEPEAAGAPDTEEAEATRVPGTAREAVDTVKDTDDADQLNAWAEGEDRKSVLRAITKRLADLED